MGAEKVFERVDVVLEAVRGTPIATPTHHLYMDGMLDADDAWFDDSTNVGVLAGLQRSQMIHTAAKMKLSGAMDVWTLPVLLNMALAPVTTPTTPGGGTLSRDWTFNRVMTADSIKSGTFYWGDPNTGAKVYQSAFGMCQTLKLSGDASGTKGAMQEFDGIAQVITPLGSPPTYPNNGLAPLIVGARMQLYIDTASAIGTTAVTGRVVSANVNIPVGVLPKYMAVGPSAAITYSLVGRAVMVPEMTIQLDKVDEVEFNHYQASDNVKVRLIYNGPLIEGALYNMVQVDMYGKLRFGSWKDLAGNRTVELVLRGEYNATPATDVVVVVRNNRTTL